MKNKKKIVKIGHRGAAGYLPENTIASFNKALGFGLDYIECDVQLTKDNQLVVFHDKLIDRVTNGTGYIWDYTYEQLLKEITVLNTAEKIPLLKEVIRLIKNTQTNLYIELKTENIEEKVISFLGGKQDFHRYIVASFLHEPILNLKKRYPELRTVALFEGVPISLEKIIIDTQCDVVSVSFASINMKLIETAHGMNVPVFVYTVDDAREIERAIKMGVDGIVSNFPDRIETVEKRMVKLS